MTTLTLCLLQNLLSFQSKFLLRSKVRFVPVGFVPFSLDNFLDLLQVAHKFIYKESHFKIIFQATKDRGRDLLCSSSRPQSFILLASCWAFFFSLQAREASLFFSLRDLVLLWKINNRQAGRPVSRNWTIPELFSTNYLKVVKLALKSPQDALIF